VEVVGEEEREMGVADWGSVEVVGSERVEVED
jgi:hypothetical protein